MKKKTKKQSKKTPKKQLKKKPLQKSVEYAKIKVVVLDPYEGEKNYTVGMLEEYSLDKSKSAITFEASIVVAWYKKQADAQAHASRLELALK